MAGANRESAKATRGVAPAASEAARWAASRHEFQFEARSQRVRNLAKRCDRRVSPRPFQLRDLLLGYADPSGELRLGESSIESRPPKTHCYGELRIDGDRHGAATLAGPRRRAPVNEVCLEPTGQRLARRGDRLCT